MTIETTTAGVLALIAIMTVVTLVTRFGGVFAMSFVRISPRIESFINTMASSVLIAIVVPMAFSGDAGAVAGLSVTARYHAGPEETFASNRSWDRRRRSGAILLLIGSGWPRPVSAPLRALRCRPSGWSNAGPVRQYPVI